MLKRISFENSMGRPLQVCIEPVAEYYEWGLGERVELVLGMGSDKSDDEIEFAMTDLGLVVYENFKFEIKIFIDKELKYCTAYKI